jgi:hypothetical protein
MRPADTELCEKPNPKEQAALEALQRAYMEALQMPHGAVRLRHQGLLCAMRDAIALETGEDAQTVQDSFESMALQVRLAA